MLVLSGCTCFLFFSWLHAQRSVFMLVVCGSAVIYSEVALVLPVLSDCIGTCSEFSLVRNLRWVTAGYLSLLRRSVVQRRNRDGSSSVSMRHFSLTTLTTTWTYRRCETGGGTSKATVTMCCSGSDLVELDRGRATAIGRGHHNIPSSGEGNVSWCHASSQSTKALAGCQQSTTWLQQWHGHQTAHRHSEPALHWLATKQSQRGRELYPWKLLAKVGRTWLNWQNTSKPDSLQVIHLSFSICMWNIVMTPTTCDVCTSTHTSHVYRLYHLHMQSELHAIVQPAQCNNRISIHRTRQNVLPAVHQVIRHGPAFNLTITVCR